MKRSDAMPDPGWTGEVKLGIFDFECEPDGITRLLARQPSQRWRAGERAGPKVLIRYRTNGWVLKGPLPLKTLPDQTCRDRKSFWRDRMSARDGALLDSTEQ
jgi:hypothetical protein